MSGEVLDQLFGRCLGYQFSASYEDQLVGDLLHFAHQVAGDEDGSTVGRTGFHQLADPGDAFSIKAVHRFVQDEDLRVSEQRGGDAQTLAHTQGESADALMRDVLQSCLGEDFGDAGAGKPVALHQGLQEGVRRLPGMPGSAGDMRAYRTHRVAQLVVAHASDQGLAAGGCVESEDHAHGGGFAGTVGSEESGHCAGVDVHRQILNCVGASEIFAQRFESDHGVLLGLYSNPRNSQSPVHRLLVGIRWVPSPYFRRCRLGRIMRSMNSMTTSWKQIGLLTALALCAYLVPISTNGSWILLAPLSAFASYLAGRHVGSLLHGVLAFATGTVAATLTLVFSSHVSLLTFALNIITGLVLFALLPWWIGRARRNTVMFRAQEREHAVVQAELRERARIAEAMHDQLGHDLALLALSASALQVAVQRDTPAYKQAVRIREQADESIDHLHQIIGVLHDASQPEPLDPAVASMDRLLERARANGMEINYVHEGKNAMDPVAGGTAALLHQVVQESLTNAAKYAPNQQVDIELDTRVNPTQVRISNSLVGQALPVREAATGLKSLRRSLEAAGGMLQVNREAGRFELLARIPQASDRLSPKSTLAPVKKGTRGLMIALPVIVAAAIAAGLYLLQDATYKATALNPANFQQLQVGMDREEVSEFVSAKGLDEPLPVINAPSTPPAAQCRYFAAKTGVLDLGSEMFRLCFAQDILVSADHLYPTY